MYEESTTDVFHSTVPAELLAEARRAPRQKDEQLRVEGWRPSWLSRVTELLAGRD